MTGTWRTNWRGNTYALNHQGQLRKETPMTIDDVLAERFRTEFADLEYRHNPHTINRIVADELNALAKRRAAHKQEQTP